MDDLAISQYIFTSQPFPYDIFDESLCQTTLAKINTLSNPLNTLSLPSKTHQSLSGWGCIDAQR